MVSVRRGITKVGCLFWVLVVAAAMYFVVHSGDVYFKYLEYKDAMKQEVRFHTHLTDAQIKTRLQLLADSLGLPEQARNVNVTRSRGQITIEAQYDEVIEFPFVKRVVHFAPRATGTY